MLIFWVCLHFSRLEAEGPASVLDALKPSDKDYMFPSLPSNSFSQLFGTGFFRNGPFDAFRFQPTPESGSHSSTVTIYSNVNGRTSVEKIIRHPDGVSFSFWGPRLIMYAVMKSSFCCNWHIQPLFQSNCIIFFDVNIFYIVFHFFICHNACKDFTLAHI